MAVNKTNSDTSQAQPPNKTSRRHLYNPSHFDSQPSPLTFFLHPPPPRTHLLNCALPSSPTPILASISAGNLSSSLVSFQLFPPLISTVGFPNPKSKATSCPLSQSSFCLSCTGNPAALSKSRLLLPPLAALPDRVCLLNGLFSIRLCHMM